MGELEYEVHDGVGMLFDRTAFAGSTTLLNRMIPIVIEQVGVPLVEAVRMASLTPARVIGVDEPQGQHRTGQGRRSGHLRRRLQRLARHDRRTLAGCRSIHNSN